MLVKVWTELDNGTCKTLLAKIFRESRDVFTIRYLSKTAETDHGRTIYRYEDQEYEIGDDSIVEYISTDDEEALGYIPVDGGFVCIDSDEDYEPSESEVEEELTDDEEEDVTEEDYSLDED